MILIELNQYRQIKSILLVLSSINKIDLSKNIKNLEIFHSNEPMIIRLEELINEIKESDDNLFQQQKSLRDVHQELGPFVWSHPYQG
jgi:hypothetical protein